MTRNKGFKIPMGCLVAVGIAIILGCAGVFISALTGGSATNPSPTIDTSAIGTSTLETALAMNLQTLAVPSPVIESTITPFVELAGTSIPITGGTQVESSASFNLSDFQGASCIPNNPPQTGTVVQVVDGDTIRAILDEDGLTYSIRYIGMDTPENTSQVEYFGPESTAKNIELVNGKTVTLIKDVSETDMFGRLLRYVLTDTVFVNYELVAQGYANTASYPPDIACIPTFQDAERQASVAKLGLWAAPPTLAVVVAPTVASGGSGNSGGNAPCSCGGPDLNCPDLGSQANAQACFDYCREQGFGDVFGLDRDNDGLACESN